MTDRLRLLSIAKAATVSGACVAVLLEQSVAAETSPPTPAGYLPHFESLIALGVVSTTALIAWLLNHPNPKRRALGTGLAGLSCFLVVGWFGLALQTGVIENPKPFQTPMDAAKPVLLWAQVSAAFVGGVALFAVAARQFSSTETLILGAANEESRYGRVSRMLHWVTAILFVFMIPTGIYASMIPEDVWYRTEYNVVHKTIGVILFGLVVTRVIWNAKSKRPELDSSLKTIERKLAHYAHVTLYVLMFALPITGYLMTSLHGYPTFFFVIRIESFLPESEAYILWGLFHKYVLQYVVYLVLGAHVLGALKHQFIDKHSSAFKRMVS